MTEHSAVARRRVAEWLRAGSRQCLALAGVLAAALSLVSGILRAQEASLTIYQDGRVVVRRTFATPVPRGVTTIPVDLGAQNVDPGTLVALDDGVEIRGATVSAATGLDAALRRSVGQDIDFMVRTDSAPRFLRATLLSVDQQTVRLNGRVLFGYPGTPTFPESLVSLAPRVELTLEAARAQRALRLAYQANGLQWRASYSLVVPRGAGARSSLAGFATIEDPGNLSFKGAEVQLLAGDVRQVGPGPRAFAAARSGVVALEEAAVTVGEQSVGETHLYTLSGTVDLLPGQSETVALFSRADVQAEPEYLLRNEPYYYRMRQPQAEQDLHAEVSYLVRRPRGTPFGDAPLPAGVVRVVSPDSSGRLQLLGETQIPHTPAGRELHLVTGTAFDVTAQRTQLTFEVSGRNTAVSSYRVTIQNAKTEPVTVQVLDQFSGDFQVLSSSVPAERLSSSSLRFPVAVPAGGEASLEYRIRARW
jgi:hypothetical protein